MKRLSFITLLICTYFLSSLNTYGCTTAVISGKYTKNGKPIIWKVRDTQSLYNKVQIFEDGKYKYVALTNALEHDSSMVWGGYNEYGFAIMNSASFNTNLDNPTEFCDQEGIIMKKALQSCKTLKDFEKLLSKLKKPMGLNANFGVIDAKGGAAYYETDNNKFVKFDANDPRIAPNGYIIRTNYSYVGKKDIGYGFIRYESATELFYQMDSENKLDAKQLATETSRSLYHGLLKTDYATTYDFTRTPFINNGDLICRHETASAITIEGTNKESDRSTTMWCSVAFPLSTPSIPIRLINGNQLPQCITAPKGVAPELSKLGMKWKEKLYPIKRSSGYKYMNLKAYVDPQNGIKNKIEKLQKEINKHIPQSEDSKEWEIFYRWVDQYIPNYYNNN